MISFYCFSYTVCKVLLTAQRYVCCSKNIQEYLSALGLGGRDIGQSSERENWVNKE